MAKPASKNQKPASTFLNAAEQARALARKQLFPPFAKEPCEDQAVATVVYTRNGFRFVVDGGDPQETLCHTLFTRSGFDKKKGWNLGNDGLLLMVLESPHQDEFDKDLKPLGPARGATGKNIGNHLKRQHHYLKHLEKVAQGRYRLVLMNAIRYQCSLGVSPTSVYRDFIFRNVWEQGGREHFVTRLEQYLKGVKNHLVFACCSKGETILQVKNGSGTKDLRDLVCDAARTVVKENRLFVRPHPSSVWFFRKPPASETQKAADRQTAKMAP